MSFQPFNPEAYDNAFGLDSMLVTLTILPCLTNPDNLVKNVQRVEGWLSEQIGREITRPEKVRFTHAVADFIMSVPGTQERNESVAHIITLQFLDQPTAKTTQP